MYRKSKECYQVQYQAIKVGANEWLKNKVMCFCINPGLFSNHKDAVVLSNAEQQKSLNNSKLNRKINKQRRRKKYRNTMEQFFGKFTWKDIITFLLYMVLPYAVLGVSYIEIFFEVFISFYEIFEKNILDIYLAQLSLTFITISVMSIFSDGNVVIYWQNVVKQMLIEPVGRCFKAYFGYSFVYLLSSTLFLLLGYGRGVVILFLFNILCLFDLSRIMINCYYGQKSKQEKLVKEFIKKIEKANVTYFKRLKREAEGHIEQNFLEEVIDTFDTFNYYTTEAYNSGKYNTLKENLAVYGTLLARVNSAIIETDQFPLLDWYNEKTYKYYRPVVKNYYTEYFSLILGNGYSNTSTPRSSIEREIIYEIIFNLSNDIHNHIETNSCYELVLYKFLEIVYLAARNEDADNLEKYKVEINNCYDGNWLYKNKKIIGEKFEYLKNFYNEDLTESVIKCMPKIESLSKGVSKDKKLLEIQKLLENKELYRWVLQHDLHDAVAQLMGDVVLFNTEDISCLRFLWFPLKEIKDKDKLFDNVKKYVESKYEKLSPERQDSCKNRLKHLEENLKKDFEEIPEENP